MNNIEELRNIFKNDVFATEMGVNIDKCDTECVCSLEINSGHLNAGGRIQGGVLFTIADFAFAILANSKGTLTVTSSANIDFIKGAKGGKIFATAKMISEGRTTCLYSVEVKDSEDNLLAYFKANGHKLEQVKK